MHQPSQPPLPSRRAARSGVYAVVGSILCLSVVALVRGHEVAESPRAIAGLPTPRVDPAGEPPSAELSGPRDLDAAAELQIERLSRLSNDELVTAARRASGFSRLLAMNVLWARGEHATVDQVAQASGDPTLLAKARALANRTPNR